MIPLTILPALFQDVLAGLLYVSILMPLYFLVMDALDDFLLHHPLSLLVCVGVPLLMCAYYPPLDRWSTARGDTTVVVSVASGVYAGAHIAYQTGFMHHGDAEPPFEGGDLGSVNVLLMSLRLLIGVVFLVATRAIVKSSSLKLIGRITNVDTTKKENLQQLTVELFYKFSTYFSMAIVCMWIVPIVFLMLGIQRDSYFYEL